MTAEELRIGNLIEVDGMYHCKNDPAYYEDWNVEVVRGIYNDFELMIDNDVIIYTKTESRPIPLTEEWLLKFGFERTKWIESTLDKDKFRLHQTLTENGMINEFYHDGDFPFDRVIIGSVHQLQNLFYCLTGNELTLNK